MNLLYADQTWTAPLPPDAALDLMPENTDSFWEGFLQIVLEVLPEIQPAMAECMGVCMSIVLVVVLVNLSQGLSDSQGNFAANIACAACIGILLTRASQSLIALGADTVQSISEYGKLLLPVMTAAMAGGGGNASSAALYGGTTVFDAVLMQLITLVLLPLLMVFLCFSIGNCALGNETLKRLSGFVKWLMTWCLKLILYAFTGFISITGVVGGAADAAALKATKLTITGMVPVVGGILSDASEAVLVGADLVRSAAGIYGMLAILAIGIRPFLQIGVHYLLLKVTGAVCGLFAQKQQISLVQDYTWAMGFVLAMTGTCCLILFISIICFMKGVG